MMNNNINKIKNLYINKRKSKLLNINNKILRKNKIMMTNRKKFKLMNGINMFMKS